MAMHVIGAGVGRTGTYSLKLAINRLGFGPCHHMEAVMQDMAAQVPLWSAALSGHANWNAIYAGFGSAVDWPTAAFFRDLVKAYPSAKFILTHRNPETWADSFGETIYTAIAGRDQAPPDKKAWLDMAYGVIAKTGFPEGLSRDQLIANFIAHNDAVMAEIPAQRLLVYQVKEGWEPLCEFLGADVPDELFPRTNDRAEFWELIKRA
jgi:hypothetical protein